MSETNAQKFIAPIATFNRVILKDIKETSYSTDLLIGTVVNMGELSFIDHENAPQEGDTVIFQSGKYDSGYFYVDTSTNDLNDDGNRTIVTDKQIVAKITDVSVDNDEDGVEEDLKSKLTYFSIEIDAFKSKDINHYKQLIREMYNHIAELESKLF